jgi:hypothetical protein
MEAALAIREKPRRRLNRAEKRALKTAELAKHVQQVSRKAPKHGEPNDRSHDPEFDKKLRRVPPVEMDRLLRDDEEE